MSLEAAFVHVRIRKRAHTFYVACTELRGIHLCGPSLQDVRDDVRPMIERLHRATSGVGVRAVRTAHAISPDGPGDVVELLAFRLDQIDRGPSA
jgi:hypothetical protein